MTLRERIADWISGGALSLREVLVDGWELVYRIETDAHRRAEEKARLLQAKLDRIAACETPGANATVRRMARIAREGME
jgi:hypothetical protein